MKMVENYEPDVMILDISFDKLKVLHGFKRLNLKKFTPTILIVDYDNADSNEIRSTMMNLGFRTYDYIIKIESTLEEVYAKIEEEFKKRAIRLVWREMPLHKRVELLELSRIPADYASYDNLDEIVASGEPDVNKTRMLKLLMIWASYFGLRALEGVSDEAWQEEQRLGNVPPISRAEMIMITKESLEDMKRAYAVGAAREEEFEEEWEARMEGRKLPSREKIEPVDHLTFVQESVKDVESARRWLARLRKSGDPDAGPAVEWLEGYIENAKVRERKRKENFDVMYAGEIIDGKQVIDEWCKCGHTRRQHEDTSGLGHGPCTICDCPQFTWAGWIFGELKLPVEDEDTPLGMLASIARDFDAGTLDDETLDEKMGWIVGAFKFELGIPQHELVPEDIQDKLLSSMEEKLQGWYRQGLIKDTLGVMARIESKLRDIASQSTAERTEAIQEAFEKAIFDGRLSRNPDAWNYVGYYSYMGEKDGVAQFRHGDTGEYLPAEPVEGELREPEGITIGITYDDSTEEYRVFWKEDGRDIEAKAYYTDDPEDAVQTMNSIVRQALDSGIEPKVSVDAETRRQIGEYVPVEPEKESIRWTQEKLARFEREYERRKDDPDAVFIFEGNEFLVSYAKYLIEYLRMRWPKEEGPEGGISVEPLPPKRPPEPPEGPSEVKDIEGIDELEEWRD